MKVKENKTDEYKFQRCVRILLPNGAEILLETVENTLAINLGDAKHRFQVKSLFEERGKL